LEEKTKEDFIGSRVIMNIFPSIDTNVCALSVSKFNKEVQHLENTKVLAISKDLPFAQKRYADEARLDRIVNLSDFRDGSFGKDYGVEMTTGPLRGLLSRAIVVLNENGKIIHAQQVPEIGEEPDYDAVLKSLK
jgi:thiol peroxidase